MEINNIITDAIKNGNLDSVLERLNHSDTLTDNSFKLPLKFVNKSNNPDPDFAKEGDSGFDVRADITNDIILKPLERALIPTGLYFELPFGYELQSRSRSGLSWKHGIMVLNSPGTIDEPYRGEVKIILINLSNESFTISNGDRIAQCVLASVSGQRIVDLIKISEINTNTTRSINGFGSTGVK